MEQCRWQREQMCWQWLHNTMGRTSTPSRRLSKDIKITSDNFWCNTMGQNINTQPKDFRKT
jgi:hypothetical protein|tara:strand:+ start:21805 stop:21987 length:183 start_codon:yes stop_codon:yes gene_type:complete